MTKKIQKALFFTWLSNSDSSFWKNYQEYLYPILKHLYQTDQIQLVLPFEHKALKHPDFAGQWTNSAIILFEDSKLAEKLSLEIIEYFKDTSLFSQLNSADIMILQNGLDMFYPLKNGIEREPKMTQTLEYVFSDPKHRRQYYEDQYKWSGPSMKSLHKRDMTGRFIGFEVEKRLYNTKEMPEWDLIHVVGFTRWQIFKSIPFFFSVWNQQAKKAFGENVTFNKKLSEWKQIRLNIKSKCRQNVEATLKLK
jgi:hypothetical protein